MQNAVQISQNTVTYRKKRLWRLFVITIMEKRIYPSPFRDVCCQCFDCFRLSMVRLRQSPAAVLMSGQDFVRFFYYDGHASHLVSETLKWDLYVPSRIFAYNRDVRRT